jgi:hypothetical protein
MSTADIQPGMDFEAIVDALVERYAPHQIIYTSRGLARAELSPSCSCGWRSGVWSHTNRPLWGAIDAHMVEDVLPPWPRRGCHVCGRVIMLTPHRRWFHVEHGTHGHTARLTREATS